MKGFHIKELATLLALYTRDGYWLKEPALLAAIVYGVEKKAFTRYELHPTIKLWFNKWRVIKYSREAELDLKLIRERGLVEKLRLTTPGFGYVTAYRLVGKVEEDPKVERVFLRGGERASIEFKDDRPKLVWRGEEEEVKMFEQIKVPYKLKPDIRRVSKCASSFSFNQP